MRQTLIRLVLGLSLMLVYSTPVFSETIDNFSNSNGVTEYGCGTQYWFTKDPVYLEAQASGSRACTMYGPCDDPINRDAMIPDPSDPITYLRMIVHILAEDDGSDPVFSQLVNEATVATFNADLLPSRIQFLPTYNYINSSQWKNLQENEINAMKIATAIQPDSFLNVWVVNAQFGYSFGTFPFSGNAQTATGGIVMGHFHWGASQHTFAHEAGHNLGLFHTFNGIDEVAQCGPCYETLGSSQRDFLGDRCSDTEPAPTYAPCGFLEGEDPCDFTPWGDVTEQALSFMSYTSSCWIKYTEQQKGRIHCWVNDQLSSWKAGLLITSDKHFGEVPADIQFSAFSDEPVVDTWNWDFGDAGTSPIQNPLHTYTEPGVYTVGLDITTPEGNSSALAKDIVAIPYDSISGTEANIFSGVKVEYDIYLKNFIPVSSIEIPIVWSGDFSLTFDQITNDNLRTDFMTLQKKHSDYNNNRMTYVLTAPAGTVLDPGNSAILRISFNSSGNYDDTAFVNVEDYSVHSTNIVSPYGSYLPNNISNGFIVGTCCYLKGDIEVFSPGTVDIADLTFFVSFLFKGGIAPLCDNVADLNSDSEVNIIDLTYFVNYLFKGGNSPGSCF